MSLNNLFDQFLSINYRLYTIKETIHSEQQKIVHYQFKIQDPYTPYIFGWDHSILDNLKFLIRQKEDILSILQKQEKSLKEKFDDLLIQILSQNQWVQNS